MKKMIMIASTILLLGGGVTYVVNAGSDPMPKAAPETEVESEIIHNELADTYESNEDIDYESLEEYETLVEIAGNQMANVQVMKDNHKKRKMLLMNDQGQPQLKSIYIKHKNRLKVVDFNGRLVFNGTLKAKSPADEVVVKEKEEVNQAPKAEQTEQAPTTELSGIEEYQVLQNHVNINDYASQMVENNAYKRVILLKDEHGKPQYKSVFVKDTNRLKIINLRGGLVYNGIIK